MALGAIRAFEESGIRVPADVSVVGFDDIPEAAFFRPPLSTVKQDFTAVGQLGFQCLITQWTGASVSPKNLYRKSDIRRTLQRKRTLATRSQMTLLACIGHKSLEICDRCRLCWCFFVAKGLE